MIVRHDRTPTVEQVAGFEVQELIVASWPWPWSAIICLSSIRTPTPTHQDSR
jgi:hypothetical protein